MSAGIGAAYAAWARLLCIYVDPVRVDSAIERALSVPQSSYRNKHIVVYCFPVLYMSIMLAREPIL